MYNSNDKLIENLHSIIYKLQYETINTEQVDVIKEMILKFNFSEFNKNKSEKDMLKYLSIGWYICENIENF